jgi:hypothetical protein
MSMARLKLYCGPEETAAPRLGRTEEGQPCVSMSLREALPLLADAFQSRRTWLRDFEDDEITLSADLYEVLLAYQYYRRPSA